VTLLFAFLLAASPAGVVVVAPPEPAGAAATPSPWIAQAVADGLPRALALLGVSAVERSDRLRAQEALGLPAGALTSRATFIRLSEALGASRLLVGTYELTDPQLRLSLRILDVERAALSAPFIAIGPLESLGDLVHSLAWDIALSGPTPPTRTREQFRALRRPVPFEALRAYAEGLATPEPEARLKLLERALALDAGYDEARLTLGQTQLETREWPAAFDTFGRIGAGSPHARSARFLQGVALLQLGRYREASDLYLALVKDEATPGALSNQASALLRLKSTYPRASTVYRRAVDLEPSSTDLPFNLGWALLVEGDGEASAFWLRGVVEDEARDNQARLLLTWALRKAGKEGQADEEWRALSAATSSYEALAAPDLSRRFERIQTSERALLLDVERRSDAELAATHAARATALAEAGNLEGAEAELVRAAYLDPHAPRVHLLLARAQRRRGDREKAVGELRMSLWCRDDEAVRMELALLLKEMGREAEARTEARRVLETDPGNDAARKLAAGS
jgi:tetratricopeptide (TPR) repeat protein